MKKYLLTYNSLLAIGWLLLLLYTMANGLQLDRFSLLLLNICQLAAILEIYHAIKKWVNSPPMTAAIQVASRVFVLFLINLLPADAYWSIFGMSGLALILVAWSVTEIIRYSFYFSQLLDKENAILRYLRYTLFLGLYPMGVTGEILIILSFMCLYCSIILCLVMGGILLSYVYFFPQMYGYMIRQRLKKIEA